MLYIGIDVAKRSHSVGIEDIDGDHIGDAFEIANTNDGFAKLSSRFSKVGVDQENCIIGMEATGHYWLNLFEFSMLSSLLIYCVLADALPRSLPTKKSTR